MDIRKAKSITHFIPEEKKEGYPYALSANLFQTGQLCIYSEKVRPGSKSSAPHYHESIDEVVYVLEGELVAVEGDEECTLNENDAVCFKANSKKLHYLENRSNQIAKFLLIRKQISEKDVIYEV